MTVLVNSTRKKISVCIYIENINYLSMFYMQRNFKGISISTFKRNRIENLYFFLEINFTTVWK